MRIFEHRRICLLLSALLALCVSFSACGPQKPSDSSSDSAGVSDVTDESDTASEDETSSDLGDDSGDEQPGDHTGSAGAGSRTDNTPSAGSGSKSSASSRTGSTVLVPNTDAEKWGTEPGLKSTKVTPAWMKKIPNGKLVWLNSSKLPDENAAYYEQLYKNLTGKKLEITYKLVEWNSLRSQLQTMVLAENAPDIFKIYNGVGIYLRNKGLTRNIKDYINMNDAAWEEMKPFAEPLFYKGQLTGVPVSRPSVTAGFIYNKTLVSQAALDDPVKLFNAGKWDIKTFLKYVEELTVDANHDGAAEVFGVSMPPETIFKLALAAGEDIVKLNNDGTFSNNLRHANFTRYASYASQIVNVKSYDAEPWTGMQRFLKNEIAFLYGTPWQQFDNKNMINMKKQGKMGWVPFPKDSETKTYYHSAEIDYLFLPKNSKNPQGAAAFIYMLRYAELNPNQTQEKKLMDLYVKDYGWTAEEYNFVKDRNKKVTPILFNWMHVPDFSYQHLWGVFTTDWNTVVETVYPILNAALAAQNK